MSLLAGLVDPITKLFTKGLDKLAADKNKKLEVEAELKLGLAALLNQEGMAFEKRVLKEYDNPNWFRDAVRPIITYTAWGLYCFVKGMTIYIATKVYFPMLQLLTSGTAQEVYGRATEIKALLKEYIAAIWTEWDVYILISIVVFWFGPKAFERLQRTGKAIIKNKLGTTGGLVNIVKGWILGKPKGNDEE